MYVYVLYITIKTRVFSFTRRGGHQPQRAAIIIAIAIINNSY